MIDGFLDRRRGSHTPRMSLRPADKENMSQMVVSDHSKDGFKPHTESQPTEPTDIDEPELELEQPETDGKAGNGVSEPISTMPASSFSPAPPKRSFGEWLQDITKKQWIVASLVFVVLAGGGVAAFVLLHHTKPTPVAVHVTKKPAVKPAPPAPTTVASTLSGLQVNPDINQRPVTAVMIENSTFARPQSGLTQANVVFEAVAEGGITRFLALFQDTNPTYLGPVRSVRPYYIQWALGFNAAIAHVGGSPEALRNMKDWQVKDLDQFYNSVAYHRISSRDAPHNVYTSIDALNSLESSKGIGAPSYHGFIRKPEQPSTAPTAKSIDLILSSSDYNVHYDYDAATNSYKRSEGGKPHMEADESGALLQVTPKVVVALVMTQGIEADDLHTSYNTVGSGHVYVFQDGTVTEGTWSKTDRGEQLTFTDSTGKPLLLNPGQTWLTAVNSTNNVKSTP